MHARLTIGLRPWRENAETYVDTANFDYRVQGMAERGTAPLIGREVQLAQVGGAIARVRAGEPSVALILGEAGAGKSRLLRAALAQAGNEDFLIAEGYGLPGQALPPYYAIGRALRRIAAELPPEAPERQLLMPLLEPVLSSAGLATPTSDPGASEGRLRLLEAMAALAEAGARQRPLLIVMDDMQWAGRGDWDAVVHMVRVATGPLGVIIAARDTGQENADAPAAGATVELNRLRRLIEVRLGLLSPTDSLSGKRREHRGQA